MTEKLKVALIGCGRMGYSWDKTTNKNQLIAHSHFSAIMKSQEFELVAVAEKNIQTREEITSNHGIRAFSDYKEMLLSLNDLHLVVLATPDETHYDILMNLVPFKPKCVFVEKPLAMNSNGCSEVANEYRESGIHLFINFSRRFLPEFKTLKKEILSADFGIPLSLTIHYSGSILHNGIHFLDLAHWYFGKPVECSITGMSVFVPGKGHGNEPNSLQLIYEDGFKINLIGLGMDAPTHHDLDFIGNKGRFRVTTTGKIIKYGLKEFLEFPDFHFFDETERSIVNYALSLPNAYDEISQSVTNGEPPERQSEVCAELSSWIENAAKNL